MVSQGHAWCTEGIRRALSTCPARRQAGKTVATPFCRRKIIGEAIARLLAAGFIMEVYHPDWLANPVLVLTKNGKWQMCIDYTSLNKACPKDPFALPRIDQVIDPTAGCTQLSFLYAYSGYHQIKLNRMIKSRPLSSLRMEPTATPPCHSA